MTSWIYLTLTVTVLFLVVCSLAEDYDKEYEAEFPYYWSSTAGHVLSPKLRHFHPQQSENSDYMEPVHMKHKKHNRRSSFPIIPSGNLTKGFVKHSKKMVCRDESNAHNETEEELCPEFAKTIQNVTQAVGRDVKMECVVNNLGRFRVAWLRIETKTVLTMHRHVISRNYRITLSHSEHRVYVLHIRNVQEDDRGSYMCQVNTVPMLFQIGYLDIVVPPDIIEDGTSSDLFAREGTDVTLKCLAKGRPEPWYTWRREDNRPVVAGNWQNSNLAHIIRLTDDRPPVKNVTVHEGPELTISRVSRLHMGAYLCIASNGVPPAVSRRIQLQVNFPPMIWIPNQLVGAPRGGNVTIECNTEGHPESINYWSRHDGEMVSHGEKFDVILKISTYKVNMILTVRSVVQADYGTYKCFARNSLGSTEGTIRLYEIHVPHMMKEPSSAKIHSLGGTAGNINMDLDSEEEEAAQSKHNDMKYPNTDIHIYDDSDSSGLTKQSKVAIIMVSISILAANYYWLFTGT